MRINPFQFAWIFFAGLLVMTQYQGIAFAEDFSLEKTGVPIAHHETNGGRPFPPAMFEESKQSMGMVLEIDKEGRAVKEKKKSTKAYATRLPVLPDCRKSSVDRIPAGVMSFSARDYDFVIYNPRSSSQRALAAEWTGSAVAYDAGRVAQQPNDELSTFLSFALSLDLNCLPTRFHFAVEDRARYFETRRGDRAWDKAGN